MCGAGKAPESACDGRRLAGWPANVISWLASVSKRVALNLIIKMCEPLPTNQHASARLGFARANPLLPLAMRFFATLFRRS